MDQTLAYSELEFKITFRYQFVTGNVTGNECSYFIGVTKGNEWFHILYFSNLILLNSKIEADNLTRLSNCESITLLTDGWSCVNGESHIQFLASTPSPVFLKSVNPTTNKHSAAYIAAQCSLVIKESRASVDNFNAICTDHASNMVAALKVLVEEFPFMTVYGCSAHAFGLLAKDIQKIFSVTVSQIQQVSKFFRNHHMAKAVQQEYAIQLFKKPLVCLVNVITRWNSAQKMLMRNLALLDCLKLTVCNHRCSDAVKKCPQVKALIMDESFWQRTKAAERAISEVESDSSSVSVVHTVFKGVENSAI